MQRDIAKIESEWELDKYAKLLDYYDQHPEATPDDLRKKVLFGDVASPYELMAPVIANAITDTKIVIELGCGFGYNFYALRELLPQIFSDKEWVGGEYSMNAVEVAKRLFKDAKNVSVVPFNYYDKVWDIFENLKEPAVVFTRHSIEQLPKTREVLLTLSKYKDKVRRVIHFEPVLELTDDGTQLGILRRAYAEMNDYNTDLLSAIRNVGGKIIKSKVAFITEIPLNPTSLVEWEFGS